MESRRVWGWAHRLWVQANVVQALGEGKLWRVQPRVISLNSTILWSCKWMVMMPEHHVLSCSACRAKQLPQPKGNIHPCVESVDVLSTAGAGEPSDGVVSAGYGSIDAGGLSLTWIRFLLLIWKRNALILVRYQPLKTCSLFGLHFNSEFYGAA